MTSKDILETEIPALLKEKPELAKDLNAVVHFVVSGDGGGTWTLDGTTPESKITEGAQGEPKMVVTSAVADFEKIIAKQMNAQQAVMTGKLKIKPMDMGLAMKLAKIVG